MKISLKWLEELVGKNLSHEQLDNDLVSLGLEVDGIEGDVLEISIPANRGDCLSAYGIARELCCLHKKPTSYPTVSVESSIDEKLIIENNAEDRCARYASRVITGVNNKASTPSWIASRLEASEISLISPVVDITNYVMLELGQPMHAFDKSKIGSKIIIRKANAKESILLLDNEQIEMTAEDLVIASDTEALAIAGVMGGLPSSVTEDTTEIVLESAWFEPVGIRLTSRGHKLITDSSYRFERSVDYNLQKIAIERATEIIVEVCGGNPGTVVVSESLSNLPQPTEVQTNAEYINSLLSTELSVNEIQNIFEGLGFSVSVKDNVISALAPSFRQDIAIPEDLVEEVARVIGLDKIEPVLPKIVSIDAFRQENTKVKRLQNLRQSIANLGYVETISYSFIDPKYAAAFDILESAKLVINPISEDLSVMRKSLWPGLVKSLQLNLNHQRKRAKLFEISSKFLAGDGEGSEELVVSGLLCGAKYEPQWGEANVDFDYYDVKGDVENILATYNLSDIQFKVSTNSNLHPGVSADIFLGNSKIGVLGRLHPKLCKDLDLPKTIFVFEINLDILLENRFNRYQGVSKFPSVKRDINLVLPQGTEVSSILSEIKTIGGAALTDVAVVDVFEGKGIEPGRRSVTFTLSYQLKDRTLNDEEINASVDGIVSTMERNCGATLRS